MQVGRMEFSSSTGVVPTFQFDSALEEAINDTVHQVNRRLCADRIISIQEKIINRDTNPDPALCGPAIVTAVVYYRY